jgi:hypothetical protein
MAIQDGTSDNLKRRFKDVGVNQLYLKVMPANDNSKQQVYLGGSFAPLNIFPIGDLVPDPDKPDLVKASLNFKWLTDDGSLVQAPGAQLILYPQYPEVRFSGFLENCFGAPNDLMRSRQSGRPLFLGTTSKGEVIGFVAAHDSALAREILHKQFKRDTGVFSRLAIMESDTEKDVLYRELWRIASKGWIGAKRLDRDGTVLPCNGTNCGGMTLEAELGVRPNSLTEPDFQGWEIKSHKVSKLNNPDGGGAITLMTPEPTGGIYAIEGIRRFMERFGYSDRSIADRINFGGIHQALKVCNKTGLLLTLGGYDIERKKIDDFSSGISLLDVNGEPAATWNYKDLLKHWMRKHAKAAYVPSLSRKTPANQYQFGSRIRIAEGTDFSLFLNAVASGDVYYDPGIKIENVSAERSQVKKRSQFRIRSSHISALYKSLKEVNLEAQL